MTFGKPNYMRALDILKKRNGKVSSVALADGRVVTIYNIAWGYDFDDPVAHITTNISPAPTDEPSSDFFFADQIVRIVDPDDGAVWFEV